MCFPGSELFHGFFFFFVTYIKKYKDLSNQKENSSQSRHNRLKLIHHNFPISLGGHLAGSSTLSVWLTESLQLMEFSPLFVVAMVTQYSQACHVHRSVAAAPLQTHNCSQLLTIDKNSLRRVSLSGRKSLQCRSIRAGTLALPLPLSRCAIIIKITLNSHEFTHSQTLSKKVQEFKGTQRVKERTSFKSVPIEPGNDIVLDIILFWP